jgi:succinate dehydrogenase / fumarate reductase cytochrome b subunit
MALSAIFLMIFLLQHFAINMTSVFSEDVFNSISHFMGTNFVVQFIFQPILIFGVIFHFVMGFVLELRNRNSRAVGYAEFDGNSNSTWMSRNMILTGLVILAFMGLHFYDFWIPEITTKYINGDTSGLHNGSFRYYEELVHKFQPLWRVVLYCISFVLLSLHLQHGFSSSLQSMGIPQGRKKTIKTIGNLYAIIIPLGFIFIAIYHFATH